VRGEEMNAETRRSNPRHCCIGQRFAYAYLWNRVADAAKFNANCPQAGRGCPAEKLTSGARGPSV